MPRRPAPRTSQVPAAASRRGEARKSRAGPAEGEVDPVADLLVAPVEHLGEAVGEQRDDLLAGALRAGDRGVSSSVTSARRTGRPSAAPISAIASAWRPAAAARQLVGAAAVALLREGGDGDVGDVLGVDERLGRRVVRRDDELARATPAANSPSENFCANQL